MTAPLLALALLAGCPAKPPPTGSAPTGLEPGTGDTSVEDTQPTTDTASSTEETWGPPVAPWAVFRLNLDGEPPFDNALDNPNYVVKVVGMPDITGDGRPDIVAHRYGASEVRSGLPPAGEADLRDGIDFSFSRENPNEISYAGDLDGDGIGDLWQRDCLHFSPFDSTAPEGDLCLNMYNPSHTAVTFGNVDADGDGVLDVILTSSSGWMGVAYGPFLDTRTVDDPRHAENTTFGPRGTCGLNDSSYIGPADTPEQRFVAVSGFTDCPPALVDAGGPRGRTLTLDQITTYLPTLLQPVVHNLRQDGLVHIAVSGKLIDDVASYAQGGPRMEVFIDDSVMGGVRDLTGDGRDEIISFTRVERRPDRTEDWLWYVVPGRPDLLEADPTALGVHLGGFSDHGCHDFTSFDLDGDGLGEVIGWNANRMVIWRGGDIRDALLAAGKLPDDVTQ